MSIRPVVSDNRGHARITYSASARAPSAPARVAYIVGLALMLLVPAQTVCAGTGEHLLAGCEQMHRGQWRAAFDSFEQAGFVDATCSEALVGQGAALLQMGKLEEADRLFEKAAIQSPEVAAAYAGTAACRYLQGDMYAAMVEYRQALSRAQSHRPELRASAAWIACRMGLYESALGDARTAVGEAPTDSLARHVLGAALLGLLRSDEAVDALGRSTGVNYAANPGRLAVDSALLSPQAEYWAEHDLDDEARLAYAPQHVLHPEATVGVQEPEPGGREIRAANGESDGLRIIRPSSGSTVSGTVDLAVEVESGMPVEHVAVLLDDQFVAMSNMQPFHTSIDTSRAGDGVRELRVEGYASDGGVSASASVMLRIFNGARTLAPEERSARQVAREELCGLLSLRATPLTNAQLLGRALEESGNAADAVRSYEYVFAHDPLLPGSRSDLLLAYRGMGLDVLGPSREIVALSAPGAVALTFDDGPHPVMTPWILDLLDRYDCRATFFLVGKQAVMYPDLVQEIVDRGHEIGSHSQTHVNLSRLDRLGVEQELVRSRGSIRQACGRVVTLFRPPGGNYNDEVRRAAAATGFTTVFWTENIGNYPGREGPEIGEKMDLKLANGGIVLLHNGYDETEVALPHLLQRLKARGVRCDTISALTDMH
ncbi:MAG: polysaccharide deacetylase family protein [Armatimonadota bacterium]